MRTAGIPLIFGLLKKSPVNQFWLTKVTCGNKLEGISFDEGLLTKYLGTPVKHVATQYSDMENGIQLYEQTLTGNANGQNYWVFLDKIVILFMHQKSLFIDQILLESKKIGYRKVRFNNETIKWRW